jgi:hypothetical protein
MKITYLGKRSEGLGDTIDKITTVTGIKAAVKAVAGEGCGCEERRKKLNEMFPYNNKEENANTETTDEQGS